MSQPDATATGSGVDWWYVRAYPGSPDRMDAASCVLVPWLRDQARSTAAQRWFFMRYVDLTGHHLRLRLGGTPAALDRVHDRTGELASLLEALPESPPSDRLVPGAVFASMASTRRLRADLYAPELAKYGGAAGVDLAEQLFTRSSEWYVRNDIGSLAPVFERAGVARTFLRAVVDRALPDDADRQAFWKNHQRRWGLYLRMALPTREEMMQQLTWAQTGMDAAGATLRRLRDRIEEHVAEVGQALDAAERAHLPVGRPHLLLHYLHMDLNRWGFPPAEECLLGIAAARTSTREETA